MALQTKSITAVGAKGHHRFTLNITEDSTNINTNQSYISWSFVLSPVGNGWDWYYSGQVPVNYIVNIAGNRYDGNIMTYDGYATVEVASGNLYITHDSNGKKDIDLNFSVWSLDLSYLPGTASANGSMSLTPIPRRANITSAPNFTDEENPTITYSNPAGDAVSSLMACIVYYDSNGTQQFIKEYANIPKTGSSYTFELNESERSIIYAATANMSTPLSVVFYVTTLIGSNTYYNTLQRTITIVNADPTITSAIAEDYGDISYSTTKNRNVVINGFNYMKCSMTSTANKGASIVRRYVTCGGKYVDINDTYGILENVESGNFIFTAIDSRGNRTEVPLTKEFIDYMKPSCSLDVDVTITEGSVAEAVVKVDGNWYTGTWGSSNQTKNTLIVQYRYKIGTGSYRAWTNIYSGNDADNPYSVSVDVPNLNDQTSYTFQARVSDNIYDNVLSGEETVRATPVFDWGQDDFAFNVPVTIQGKQAMVHDPISRIARAYTQETDIQYDSGAYIKLFRDGSPTELYNQDIATFNDNGTITINKDMIALVNVHIVSQNAGSPNRSWIRLMNYDVGWQYTACIQYGVWTTSNISIVLKFTANTTIGIQTVEDTTINSAGPVGSYIEIIEL